MVRSERSRTYGPIIGAVIGLMAGGTWYAIDFLFWQQKPSPYELPILGVAGYVLWWHSELKQRLRQMESRIDELENRDST
jgi:hypothetical protein